MGFNISRYAVRYRTNLYEWGKGWVSNDKAEKWDSYLNSIVDEYPFHIIKKKAHYECHLLYTVYSIVYLHPMNGLCYFHDYKEVCAFKEFMKKLVDYCGGEVIFTEQKIEFKLEI